MERRRIRAELEERLAALDEHLQDLLTRVVKLDLVQRMRDGRQQSEARR
jgi:hypothetical protein